MRGFLLLSGVAIGVCALAPLPAAGQSGDNPVARKQARAARATTPIKLDGHLDEPIWQTAVPVTDFVQAEPNEGAAPVDGMQVRILYDETSLWIGAQMDSRNGAGGVQAPMSRRDDGDQAEYLQIELDTYLDRRTAYMFGVTASGVRLDHYHPSDNEDDYDQQFEPVWEARTSVSADGWSAEFRIPFSQLRFNDAPERIWGMNIKRWRPTLNEQDYWIVIGRTARGWASRFGDLRGIEGVTPKQRLELLPYVSGSSRMSGDRDPENPFDDGKNLTGRVGADVKIGLGSNLTLETTINPDFGQIEADPAEVNLTVFETIFTERRPFFIEGNSVLEAGTSNFYYSRRIGARPPTPPGFPFAGNGVYINFPDTSNILTAAKLTGRFKTGTSVGFLAAVTAEEAAEISNQGVESEIEVAARTAWGVSRVIQQFGNQGSTVGAHLTMVHRDFGTADNTLAAQQTRNAITTGVDTRVRFADRTYEAAGNVGLTFVDGERPAIARVQRATGHLFQRLDQPDVRYDPTRTSLHGAQTQGSINKIGGRHWLWGYNLMIESPEFEPLDFGRLNYAGDITGGPRLTYRETRPARFYRAYSTQVSLTHYWYFDTDLGVRYNLGSSNSMTFKNFWVAGLNFTQYLRGNDTQLTRGGPAMGTPLGWVLSSSLRNSNGATTHWTLSGTARGNEFGDRSYAVSGSLSARPSPSLQFSIEPEYLNEGGTNAILNGPISRQLLQTITGNGNPDTYNNRYMFGVVDRTTLSTQFRVSYTFKPDVTLDVYAEPFAASGRYTEIGELEATRSKDLRIYGTDGTTVTRRPDGSYAFTDGTASFTLANPEFNNRSFRSNVVLKWEWRPGSTLYAVWQQNRNGTEPQGEHVGLDDLFGSLKAPGDNIFAIKTTFWISR